MEFEGLPCVIGLEITLACNLNCRHCASSAGRPRSNELTTNEMIAICDQFPDLLVREVDITGGEPLVRKDWFKIAEHLGKLNIHVRMVTNGLLLKDNISRIINAGLSTVGISFDGLENTHDFIRERKGLFKRIIDGVEAAIAANIPVAAITAVNNRNVDELQELQTVLFDLGIRDWQVQPIFSRGRAKETELNLSESAFLEMGEFVKRRMKMCDASGFHLMPADGVGYYTDMDTRDHAWKGCSAGLSTCGITADGKIKGCLSLPDHFIEGDLRQNDLWDIWFNKHSFAYNRQFSVNDLGENCMNCIYGEQCKGGCSVMSYAATDRFHNDPYCFYRILEKNKSCRRVVCAECAV